MTDSIFLDAALDYVDRGVAVIPLKACSKEPATKNGLNDWSDNPEQLSFWWGRNPGFNVAGVLGQVSGGLVAIDLDVHSDSNGIEVLRSWEMENGKLPETWTSITGSGGRQLFYRVDREIRNSANGKLGVDVRGDHGYVVLPPSIHPNGESYEWGISPDDCDVAMADSKVYAFIDYVRANSTSGGGGGFGDLFELPEKIIECRNDTLYRYGRSLLSRDRSKAETDVLVRAANDSRCSPPLDKREMDKLIGSICSVEPGNELRHKKPTPAISTSGGDGEEKSIFVRSESPAPRVKDETTDKIVNMLGSFPEIRRGLKMNKFDGRLRIVEPCVPGVSFERPHVLGDGETNVLFTVLERDCGVRSKGKYLDALSAFASRSEQQYDPMADEISRLPKVRFVDPDSIDAPNSPIEISRDGGETWEVSTSVCGTLMSEYLGVEPSFYTYEAERLMFRQLVARAKWPGCKADVMVIFVGEQGCGKSSFVSLLPLNSDFFLEGFSSFDTEDIKRLNGKLVVEIPELDGFNGADKNKIKKVVTTTHDEYRESYARTPVDHLRTALFFGTTNDGTFLSDSSGARRYVTVQCGNGFCKADPRLFDGTAAEAVRQAWAETIAVADLLGTDKFLRTLKLPSSVVEESMETQERYTSEDPIELSVADFLQSLPSSTSRVNVKMVMINGLGFNTQQYNSSKRYIRDSVTSALNHAEGWRKMTGKQYVRGYGTSNAWERI